MALLHSNLGERTAYTSSGLVKAQGLPVRVYSDSAGTQPANLAVYQPDDVDVPGVSIVGASMVVDAYSNRPAFWDIDDHPVLYVTVNGGPLEPIYPDAQPQLAALVLRILALEGGGVAPTTGFSYDIGDPKYITADDTKAGISYSGGFLIVDDTLAVGVSYSSGLLTVTTAA